MAVIYCYCSLCPAKFSEKKSHKLVYHMQAHHRLDNELSDSSDNESDHAEPVQVSRRRKVTTKKATQLPSDNTTKHTDLDNANPTQPSHENHSHQEYSELRQLSITTFFKNQEGLNHPRRAAPNNKMPKTPADVAFLPSKHGAAAANTSSDENNQRLQDRGATSALITSSTPTEKRRRVLDDDSSSASDNPPKRLRPDGHL